MELTARRARHAAVVLPEAIVQPVRAFDVHSIPAANAAPFMEKVVEPNRERLNATIVDDDGALEWGGNIVDTV
jgi:hypothetical protein